VENLQASVVDVVGEQRPCVLEGQQGGLEQDDVVCERLPQPARGLPWPQCARDEHPSARTSSQQRFEQLDRGLIRPVKVIQRKNERLVDRQHLEE
jgi:hypothetical protein